MEAKTARIVPGSSTSIDAMGTEVYVGDEKLRVSKITLTASADTRIWEAVIECDVMIDGEIMAKVKDEN